ncbi:L,D-transpeptidase family protein [Oricola thermophila]|uniref:L,D-transpeptidase family protein n=1 Tax=Oricola thermophila TaxID=2742145 RepID=A0A6N1VGW5_9HYPH|nr:L,D-transpeptidase family protein [Oricola thermophila]QKV19733.1 L,D-transpeptidase family protein [Oricola thermophila]
MKSRRLVNLVLAAALAMPVVPAMSVSSEAQVQLHELLFGRARRENRNRRVREVPAEVQQAPKKIVPVSSPRYYNYKAAPVVTADIASLLPAPAENAGLEPSLDFEARRFAEALRLAPETPVRLEKDIAAALRAHYAAKPAFIWSRGNSVTAEAKAVVELLEKAGEHGLDETEYAVDLPSDGWSMDDPAGRTAELLAFDVMLSARVLRYAADMKDGVVNPNKLSGYHDFPKDRLSPEEAIAELAKADDPVAWLRTLEPKQQEYAALRAELKKLRSMKVDEIVLPEGMLVKPGQAEPDLPLLMKALRKRVTPETYEKHAATFAEYLGDDRYDEEIVALVKDFQRDNGLVADGIVGRKTVSRLTDIGHASKIRRIELALERLRWHPEEFGARHVLINQPAYRATYVEDYRDKLVTRAIVGKKSNQTSFFYDEIETVVFKPYWGVPQSIIVNEMLPKLHNDPAYLDRAGYVVTTTSGERLSSASIDWWQFNGKVPFNVRQKPGPSNALGDVKILFPNRHAIYMHDTPSRHLFDRDHRALSHGCVRLQKPREMAAAVLGKSVEYVNSRIAAGGGEEHESVPVKIPVFVSYYTAFPTDSGEVEYFPDIYGRDTYLGRALEAVHESRKSVES